jgi:CheY-like chemotaxis protein/MinD-like ATPase involved in chromosome partitioning or flagellar assembly
MSQRILVVDDEADTLKMIEFMLRRHGFEVILAQSGPEALELLAHDIPDLIILDVMMPGMDGNQVCQRIRADSRTSFVPLVMLTARAGTPHQVQGLLSGADEYLVKPVTQDELVKCVQTILARSTVSREKKSAQVISILGAKGGVGATTLAVNLALTLAAQVNTVLVDFEPRGKAALGLGVSPTRGLSDLRAYTADHLDLASVEAALTLHPSGLRLLASADVPVDAVQAGVILNHLRTMCEVCVLDLGAGADELALALTSRSNILILALDSDRVTLAQARRVIGEVKEAASPWPALKLVHINRAGMPDDVAQAAIQAAMGNEPVTVMGPALNALQQASKLGQPFVISQPDHPVAVQLRALAESLIRTEG